MPDVILQEVAYGESDDDHGVITVLYGFLSAYSRNTGAAQAGQLQIIGDFFLDSGFSICDFND